MLKYNHLFNENLDYPFHIHVIESDTTSVAISLNNVHVGYYAPTFGSEYSLNKYYNTPNILELMVVGSRQTYNKSKEASYFKESTVSYIKNTAGNFLVLDLETSKYYWSNSARTNFFFNPEYFSSKILWENIIGYVPTGITTIDLWNDDEAKNLFLELIYETDETWVGQKEIVDVEPIDINYFGNDTSGKIKLLQVDHFINELQDLQDGDVIRIDNGLEILEITVENIYTSATYNTVTETTRPITHVNIDIVNPNKKYVYSKGQQVGDQEDINITLHENDINFSIERIE